MSAASTVHARVAIVGAGLSGLTAARTLVSAGVPPESIVVVEASDRVGGRALTVETTSGARMDLGGQWIGPEQDCVLALIEDLGLELRPQHYRGRRVLDLRGLVRHYRGLVPFRVGLGPLVSIQQALQRIDCARRSVPAEDPGNASEAPLLEARSVQDMMNTILLGRPGRDQDTGASPAGSPALATGAGGAPYTAPPESVDPKDERSGARPQPPPLRRADTPSGMTGRWASGDSDHRLTTAMVRGIFGSEPRDLSSLHFLGTLNGSGGVEAMANIGPGSLQQWTLEQGAQALAVLLAEQLMAAGVRILTNFPVGEVLGWDAEGAAAVSGEADEQGTGAGEGGGREDAFPVRIKKAEGVPSEGGAYSHWRRSEDGEWEDVGSDCLRPSIPDPSQAEGEEEDTATEIRASFAVLAFPPVHTRRVRFDPPLRAERTVLYGTAHMGSVIKCIAVYKRKFWRAQNKSGEVVSDCSPNAANAGAGEAALTGGPVFNVADNSKRVLRRHRRLVLHLGGNGNDGGQPRAGGGGVRRRDRSATAPPGVVRPPGDEGPWQVESISEADEEGDVPALVAFINGGPARQWHEEDASVRREVVLRQLQRWFGPEAAEPVEFLEKDWMADPWARGGPVMVFQPSDLPASQKEGGTAAPNLHDTPLTRYGHLLHTPEGRLHWAGTETAGISQGFLDGAVRAGIREGMEVAQRIFALQGTSRPGVLLPPSGQGVPPAVARLRALPLTLTAPSQSLRAGRGIGGECCSCWLQVHRCCPWMCRWWCLCCSRRFGGARCVKHTWGELVGGLGYRRWPHFPMHLLAAFIIAIIWLLTWIAWAPAE